MRYRAIACLFLLACGLSFGQKPEFEVATIKPVDPGERRNRVGSRGGPGTDDPGRYTCENCSLAGLVSTAWDMRDFQQSWPAGASNQTFDVTAKVPPGTSKDEFREMMQNLLEDRFKLAVHHDVKDLQIYELTLAKNGPKFRESVEKPPDAKGENAAASVAKLRIGEDGFPVLTGKITMAMMVVNGRTVARQRIEKETMEHFASSTLSNQLRRPVKDLTGLTGKYDFTISWVAGARRESSSEDSGPDLPQALQEQLGLKLTEKKAPIDMIVIDHVEKLPVEN